MQTILVFPNDYDEHNDALGGIGLNRRALFEICEKILSGASQITENDAVNASGSYAYLAGVRAKRDVLRKDGWKVSRKGNLELTSHPTKDIHLLVSSGDKHTGDPNASPRTKNQKGSQTKQVVYRNSRCPFLFPEMNRPFQAEQDSSQTWFILYHLDKDKSEMRIEVSLPISFDENDLRVTGWIKRIIIDSIQFDSSILKQEPDYAEIPQYDLIKKANER